MSLPEITEKEATGRIAEIYRDILEATGLPSTNLVWRHMASFPGVLEWAYGALQHAFEEGAFQAAADEITSAMTALEVPAFGSDDGVDAKSAAAAAEVLAFYNRANPINLVAIVTLRRLLSGESPPDANANVFARSVDSPLPKLPSIPSEIDAATMAHMDAMARLITEEDNGLMPTALRHLANWPAIIARLHPRLSALVESGAVAREVAELMHAVEAQAARMPISAATGPAPDAETLGKLGDVVALFLPAISRMVVIGPALRAPLLERARR